MPSIPFRAHFVACLSALGGAGHGCRWQRALALLLVLVGSLRIASTWTTFTQTIDEPFHIACGIEWWDARTYERELQHPPLARIAVAAPLAANGAHVHDKGHDSVTEGNAILLDGGYWRNLALARAPVLAFFWLGCFAVWALARRLFDELAGLCALGVFTSLPPVLGHAGLATTDIAAAATFAFAVDRFHASSSGPTAMNTVLCGIAFGLAASSKFSNLLYGGIAAVILLAMHHRWKPLLIAVPIALMLVSATYRFRKEFPNGPTPPLPPGASISHRIGNLGSRVYNVRAFWVKYWKGIIEVRNHHAEGHWTFLLGKTYNGGDWRFFPVVMAVKTPLPALLLFFLGIRKRSVFPALLAVIFLAVLLPTNINLGVRHALHLYVPIALCAGYAMTILPRLAVLGLAAWLLVNSAMAHPHYLAWFNELASHEPERVLAESDLDWGQDLPAVVRLMDSQGLKECYLDYFGTAPYRELYPGRFRDGFFGAPKALPCLAISVRRLSLERVLELQQGHPDPWSMLRGLTPLQAGRSMRVYRFGRDR
jgi:hypothetical protein